MYNVLLSDALDTNMHKEGIYDNNFITALEGYVRNQPIFADVDFNKLCAYYNYPFISYSSLNSIYNIYNQDGSREEFIDLKNEPVITITPVTGLETFEDEVQAYNWAKDYILRNGELPYSEGNKKLGEFRGYVYSMLATAGIAMVGPNGLVLRKEDKPTYDPNVAKECTQCGKAKSVSEFPQGRNVCRECYNANRRSVPVIGDAGAGHTGVGNTKIQKLIRDFLSEQRKLMQEHRDELKDLQDDFKSDLKDILDELNEQ